MGADGQGHLRLLDSHREALVATDVAFGMACVVSLVLATFTWWTGASTIAAPLAILGFLTSNVVLSQVSLRVEKANTIEIARAVLGAVIVPGSYILVDGPLAPWWLGAMINSLGGAIVLGLVTKRPFWGRLLAIYYIALVTLAVWVSSPAPDGYGHAVVALGLAMVGFLFAEIMSLLGQAMAKEHLRSRELAAVRDALFAEMEVAQQIQTLLLPTTPKMESMEIACCMETADEVGGDYYDVLEVDGRRFIAIGDVSGHGVTSGLTMMMARTSLVAALQANSRISLAELYCTLNRCMSQNLARMDRQLYMTFALLEYAGDGRFEGVGRHLPFLIHRFATGEIEEVELDGAWLGIMDGLQPSMLPLREIQLEAGDTLLGYTDGVIEHEGPEGMFGLDGLRSLLAERAPAGPFGVIEAVLEHLRELSPTREDDVTMLSLRLTERCLSRAESVASPLPRGPEGLA
ncbi:MAG: SpoIIE family protein phosphatase [Myxococcota bacterium]